jgi:MraZ protein
MFRGANKLTLDVKGRLVMPTRYRERLQERCGGNLVVTVDKDQCLLIYPLPDWEDIERKLNKLPTLNPQVRRLQRLMIGHATDLELDSHGRLLLPANLREFGQLTRDAMLIGQGLRFELWDEARWNERRDEWLASAESSTDLSSELDTLSFEPVGSARHCGGPHAGPVTTGIGGVGYTGGWHLHGRHLWPWRTCRGDFGEAHRERPIAMHRS